MTDNYSVQSWVARTTCGSPRQESDVHCVRQAGAGGWSWNGVREKYGWSGWSWSWWLEWCERKILLGWSWSWLPNGVNRRSKIILDLNL